MNKAVKRRGFTIVELVIVVAVIAVLAAVLIPTFSGIIEKARESAAMQEALGAYTEYLIDHAAEGNDAEYIFYKTENKVVVLHNGSAVNVYKTEQEALKGTFDNPETPEDESEGISLGTVEINGLYFMQSGEQECNHSYVSVVTAPTCVNDGYTTHTCSLCGDNYTDSETPATGEHSYDNGVCGCGAEGPINDWIIGKSVGYIGEPKETSFEVFTGTQSGIYIATIESNTHYSESLFFYYPNQFISLNIPEIADLVETENIKGIELTSDHKLKKLTRSNSSYTNINVTPGKCYVLTLNFNDMTWSIEEIK
ncbi:MAG: prepilin-type N-terminal cleavage/methylation domain-containing protein [Ruminococcaceae bacterium]|nr:prepilin-type N-terminal cleavage/methylation domain-containing protein [Oscillospiraceae bacterium]